MERPSGMAQGGGPRKRTRESSPQRGATAMSMTAARSRGRPATGFVDIPPGSSSSSRRLDTAATPSRDATSALESRRPCGGCAARLMRCLIIGEDALNLQSHQVESLFLEDDEEEEEQGDALFYCPICSDFQEVSHEHGSILIALERIRGRWGAIIRGVGWSDLLVAVQRIGPPAEGRSSMRMVPVHPPAGRRCPACGGAAGEHLYCTFECMVKSGAAGARYPWAQAPIAENFEARCRLDRICSSFPSVAYSSYSCGDHHHPEHHRDTVFGQGLALPGSLQGVLKTLGGKVLVKHEMLGQEGRCIGVCTTCGDQVEEEDCTGHYLGHPCFVNDWRMLKCKTTTSKPYRRDMFCLDCRQAFSAILCTHHSGHRVLSVLSYDGRYFCVCIPRVSPCTNAFDAVQELTQRDRPAGDRLVPIRLLGAATRCPTCHLLLDDATQSGCCSLKCELEQLSNF